MDAGQVETASSRTTGARFGGRAAALTDIELVGPLDADQRARLLDIANKCPVRQTRKSEIEIATRLA